MLVIIGQKATRQQQVNLFEYKTKLIGSTQVVVPLKYLGTFWRSLDFPLINSEIELDFTWSSKYIISQISRTSAVTGHPDANPPVLAMEAILTTGATFQINNAKVYVQLSLCL